MRIAALPGLMLLVLSAGAVQADDTLRCGSRLVSTGDGKDKVRALCGEPTDVAFIGTVKGRSVVDRQYEFDYFGPVWVEQPVEVWTYNLGSAKLLRKLRFIGDELVEIRTDGRGY